MLGKLILVAGILITLLGGLVFIISLLLPSMTRNVSFDESLIGIIAGVVVVFFGIILDGVGLFLVFKKKKTPQGP